CPPRAARQAAGTRRADEPAAQSAPRGDRNQNLKRASRYNSGPMQLWPGWPYPLGATHDGEGVNFAIFSEHATAVHLCLFDSAAAPVESASIPLTERTDGVWHGYLPAGRPG